MNRILTPLPMRKSFVDWKKTKGMNIDVLYNETVYTVFVNNYDEKTGYLYLNYKDTYDYKIFSKSFIRCTLGILFGLIKYNRYNHNIGDIVSMKNGQIKILEQIRIKDNYGYNIKAYRYQCLQCIGVSIIKESQISDKTRCNICANRVILKEINSIWKTHPDFVKYFANEEDSWNYSYGSTESVYFKCPDCSHKYKRKINEFIKKGNRCPCCSDGKSYPNKFAFNLFMLLNIPFKSEYSPEWCKYLFEGKYRQGRYDFYFELHDKKYILEMDGGLGHGNVVHSKSMISKNESQYIDDEKDKLANEHNIEVIRIDCDYGSDDRLKYIKQSILDNNRLNKLFDFSGIDWNKIDKLSSSSRVKEACEYWNSGIHNTLEISKIMKLAKLTIIRYLKTGRNIGLCDYDENIEKNKGLIKGRNKNISIICINSKIIYPSAKKTHEILGVNRTGITNCCRGKDHYAGKDKLSKEQLYWMYLKDYIEYEDLYGEIITNEWENIHIWLHKRYNQ